MMPPLRVVAIVSPGIVRGSALSQPLWGSVADEEVSRDISYAYCVKETRFSSSAHMMPSSCGHRIFSCMRGFALSQPAEERQSCSHLIPRGFPHCCMMYEVWSKGIIVCSSHGQDRTDARYHRLVRFGPALTTRTYPLTSSSIMR